MLLVWFISCQILSWIWKRLKASVLPTPLTRNEQKHLPKAAQQRDSAPITNTGYLKLQRAISSTLSLLLMAFPPTTTTPNTWGNTTFFNHTPVASQCILIAADWNSTAHITCQRTDMTWSQDRGKRLYAKSWAAPWRMKWGSAKENSLNPHAWPHSWLKWGDKRLKWMRWS